MSTKLFSAMLDNDFRKLDWSQLGLNVDGKKLSYLRFAENIILLEENTNNLDAMIQALSKGSVAEDCT